MDYLVWVNFSFSTDLNTSLSQIKQYGARLGTLVGSFGDVVQSIGQLDNSTMNLKKCILICPTKVLRPSFKQPTTHNFKYRICWINWRMKGHSYDTMITFMKLPKCSYFDLSTFFTNVKSNHQCPHVYDQLQGIPIKPPETFPLWSTNKQMLTNANFKVGLIVTF